MWKLVSKSKLSNRKSNCVILLLKTLQWPPIAIRTKSKVLTVACKAFQLSDLISLPSLSLPVSLSFSELCSQSGLLSVFCAKLLPFSSVAQSWPTLCDPMNRSMPGLPVHHQLPEFTQTHVHWVSDGIQPSHPVSSPSPPAPNPSQHQSFPMSQLFAWGGQSTGVSASASFPPKKSQGWSPSEWTGWISLQSRDSQESSPTPQFKSINSSALSLLHSPTLTPIHDHWRGAL